MGLGHWAPNIRHNNYSLSLSLCWEGEKDGDFMFANSYPPV